MDRFYIAPFDADSGLQSNVEPWLIPDKAYAELNNAYVFRGRVRKRFGSRWIGGTQLSSRLRVNIGTTDGVGTFAGTTPQSGGNPIVTPASGQMFSIGTEVFTVIDDTITTPPYNMLRSGASTLATYNPVTGLVTINGASINTAIYFYPALPVMGLLSQESQNANNEPVIAFDTRFAYTYTGTGWERAAAQTNPGDAQWTGTDIQFFWNANWSGVDASDKVFFVTNFNQAEPNYMRYFFANTWTTFRPQITATPTYLDSARLLVVFKNRLVAFNTWENGNNYQNRCRYAQVGSPLAADAWRQDIPGKGNAIDAPTSEAIITAEFVKDRLIVFFERSTWELVYTGNYAYPFAWQQINTELGAESTFSVVPFDKVALGIGNVGVHACTGSNVDRIDAKIPQAVFEIHNINGGPERVYGIRDYYTEMIYWSLPDVTRDSQFPYPNRVLLYNYTNNTWAFIDDSITCFGYFQPTEGVTWSSTTVGWADATPWGAGQITARARQIVGGNQQGYTFIVDADETVNANVLQITDIDFILGRVVLQVINHNIADGDYIYIEGVTGTGDLTNLNGAIHYVDVTGPDTIALSPANVTNGVYSGAGVIGRVSQISIRTKEYNFYAEQGRNVFVSKVDCMVTRTQGGGMTVEYFVSTSPQPLLQDSQGNNSILGNNVLSTAAYAAVPFEANASRVVHPVYLQADGEFIQLYLTMSDEQMRDLAVREADFQLHYMIFYAQPSSYRPE